MSSETVNGGSAAGGRVTWAWLSPSQLDFGVRSRAGEVGGERTVWLHADPYRVLGVRPTADRSEVRRAYRRVARSHHPDLNPGDAAAVERFHDVQHAFAAAVGEPEVTVEPISGEWWSFAGFSVPAPATRGSPVVTGLTFELHDLHRVPLRDVADEVRISYAGQTLPLQIGYGGSRLALPLLRARAGVVAEGAILLLLCLALVPVIAVVLAADLYLLSDRNDVLTWASALVILAFGYGALATILASGGRRAPYPRRAVGRTRAAVAELRALSRNRTRLG